MILDDFPFLIQFSRFFSQKDLELTPPYSYAWKGTYILKCLANSKAETITETPVYTSHLGQKRGEVYD